MAVGKWNVDAGYLHEVKVRDRDGVEGTVYLREMAEKDVRNRSARMINFDSTTGDVGTAEIHIEELRKYEMEASIVKWDFEYEDADGNILPLEVNPLNIANLPQSIADKVHDEIGKLNELPQDRFEVDESGEEKVVQHPTIDNSDEK